jgi:hypothetical protein
LDRYSEHSTQSRWTGLETAVAAAGLGWAIVWIGISAVAAFQADAGFPLAISDLAIGVLPALLGWVWADGSAKNRAAALRLDRHAERIAKLSHRLKTIEATQTPEKPNADLIEKITQIANAQKKADETLAVFLSSRTQAASQDEAPLRLENALQDEAQPSLLLPASSRADIPLSTQDFIRAANFPLSANDRVGFAVMKMAMKNEKAGPFIHAAQDILTLLSHNGVYMDDMAPDPVRVEVWRNFAKGQRGRDIAPLGAIRERNMLDRIATRMREDSVFRDAVHHFLRKFDFAFTEFAETATDEDLIQFGETRSARAFMLLGRIAGTFD